MDDQRGSTERIYAYAAAAAPASPARPKKAVVIGQVVGIDESYPREVRVPRYLVMTLLTVGGLARNAIVMVASMLRYRGGAAGGRRRWKDVRKGPEYLVTPFRVRDSRGRLVELEVHGYLPANALRRKDQIRVRVRRQDDPELPPRVHHIANLTTGQILEPQPPTLWSHLGPDVVFYAGAGVLLALVAGICLWGSFG